MGFFSGRVTAARYRVNGSPPSLFGQEQLDKLAENAAGRQRLASSDGIEVGWVAGDHILDIRFELAKNIINDMLVFGMRIDTQKLPGDLLKAYYHTDLAALSANNPSGFPSAKQKREARESSRERLEDEAKDGRYLRRKIIEVVWDRLTNEVYFGTTSVTQIDRLATLFKNTFGHNLEMVTAGGLAFRAAEVNEQTRNVEDAQPSVFVPGVSPKDIAWVLDETSRDYLGNEFILWLWYHLEIEDDTIDLSDKSDVVVMLARTLTLECPRGQTGHETISSDGPTRLPEARRAVQSGKLPRKVGITMVRHDQQFEFTLHGETLSIGAAKIPAVEEENDRARLDARADQIRSLLETMDLLYERFAQIRFSADWSKELLNIQRWLQREEMKKIAV